MCAEEPWRTTAPRPCWQLKGLQRLKTTDPGPHPGRAPNHIRSKKWLNTSQNPSSSNSSQSSSSYSIRNLFFFLPPNPSDVTHPRRNRSRRQRWIAKRSLVFRLCLTSNSQITNPNEGWANFIFVQHMGGVTHYSPVCPSQRRNR